MQFFSINEITGKSYSVHGQNRRSLSGISYALLTTTSLINYLKTSVTKRDSKASHAHSFITYFQGEDTSRTRQWFKALQFYGLSLGQWRKRRNGLANIMIYGASSNKTGLSHGLSSSGLNQTASSSTTSTPMIVSKSSSLSQLVDLAN